MSKHLEYAECAADFLIFHWIYQSEYFRIFHLVDQNFDAKAMEQVCRYIYEHRIINIFAFGLSATAAEDFRFRFFPPR